MTKRKLFSVREDTSIDEGGTGRLNTSKRLRSSKRTLARAHYAFPILCCPYDGSCGALELSQALQELRASSKRGRYLTTDVQAEAGIAVGAALELIVAHRISGLPVLDAQDRVVISIAFAFTDMLLPPKKKGILSASDVGLEERLTSWCRSALCQTMICSPLMQCQGRCRSACMIMPLNSHQHSKYLSIWKAPCSP